MRTIDLEELAHMYKQDLEKYPPLSIPEQDRLIKRHMNGCQASREKLIAHNMRFVFAVASKFTGAGVPLVDLINEGSLGLVKAVDRFDPTQNVKLLTYSVWWIRAAITICLCNTTSLIRIPANHQRTIEAGIKRAARTGRMDDFTSELLKIRHGLDSFDKPMGRLLDESDPRTLANSLADENCESPDAEIDKQQTKELLRGLVDSLPSRESQVLKLLYGMDNTVPMTLQSVGEELGLSKERIRQIRERAFLLIRKSNTQRPDRLI